METFINETWEDMDDNSSYFDDNITNLSNSKASALTVQYITVVVMLSTFSIVGVIGNAIAFYIFFRRRNSSTSVIFILTLAGTDFFTCLITIPATVVFELRNYDLAYDVACKSYYFLITSTVPFSAYIMVGIALDRYFCICHPFLRAVNITRAKVIIMCMGIPALGFGIVTALSYGNERVPYRVGQFNLSGISLHAMGPPQEDAMNPLSIPNAHQRIQEEMIRLGYMDAGFDHGFNSSSSSSIFDARDDNNGDNDGDINTDLYYDRNNYHNRNDDNNSSNGSDVPVVVVRYVTRCIHNNRIVTNEFLRVYQVIHALNFAIAYVAVATLYILIYKEIYTRRARKAKRRKNNLYLVESSKDARHKKDTLHTDIHSENGPSLRLLNAKERRDQVGPRKIVPTMAPRNDVGRPPVTSRLAATEPGDNEAESLLSQVETNGTKVPLPPRAVALCEKVYDGCDSDDEGTTEVPPAEPCNQNSKVPSTTTTTTTTTAANDLPTTFGQSEAWADEGLESQVMPLIQRNNSNQSATLTETTVDQDCDAQTNEHGRRNDERQLNTDSANNVSSHQPNAITKSDMTSSPSYAYTYNLPYPHDESFDSTVTFLSTVTTPTATQSTHAATTIGLTTNNAASTIVNPLPAKNSNNVPPVTVSPPPPKSLALKSPHNGSSPTASGEVKHKGKPWQTDGQTNSIKRKRPSTTRDRNLMANIKTAIMLFIVILVFLLAFLPALLMANELIPFHLIVFYGYFVYNVANPFIYAFMNQTFREDLRKMLSVCSR